MKITTSVFLALSMCIWASSSAALKQSQPQSGSDWPTYGYTSDEQRFSPLEMINDKTVSRLGLAWSLELDQTARSLEATPLVIDGVMYFTTALSKVYAVDAVTGTIKWTYDPQP
jgi:quinohemoprotein ethanol dehydrogenase